MPQTSKPIPKLQLAIAVLIQAAEGLSGLSGTRGLLEGTNEKTGYWAGVLESVFFVAEFLSVYSWGRASDRMGRRPVLLLGPLGLAFSLFGFGWSKNFWSLVVFRCAQGIFNGNIGKYTGGLPSSSPLTVQFRGCQDRHGGGDSFSVNLAAID
ncbi:hypothetical protein B0H17DRAFT_1137339 [Mycena rosella]|uniref:Major facilitator superfamily (MFS) profile domain-containing protein n=1 Tax=Mycena rosella TaxID=1033263 RepID=A0AAD7DC67_MYCRO|nr:hypothetical protein B0H17DRAFT_1137339 [Mycena rosella]